MGNISAVAPQESLTVQQIYEWHKKRGDSQTSRGYLGASQLGKECERYLWYCFRVLGGKSSFDGRMYRLFETGNLAEKRFCDELRGIGCEVHETGEDGKQIAVHALGGHLSGHMDGVALGIPEAPKTWHVLEFKTHNAKSWEKLRSVGVKSSKPEHYAQMMVYMGLADLTRALYLAVNKDTDELHAERIEFNAKEFKVLMSKAERIIRANEPPPRISTRPDDFRCKFCDAYNMCWSHGEQAVMLPCKSCRSCCHITPEIDKDETWARWSCKKRGDITFLEQLAACKEHLLLPSFVTFAEPVDAGDDWIEFKNKDGDTWRHGKGGDGSWTTEELIKTPAIMVGKRIIEQTKKEFGGTVKSAEDGKRTLVERYPPEFSALEWEGHPKDLAAGLENRFPGLSATEPTDRYVDEAIEAVEYNGDVMAVVYKGDDYAAVWGLIPF